MKPDGVLKGLTRNDKWYLGGGNRLLWAPPFPMFLDTPGFWDEAHYYNLELKPVFTWTLLDEDGAEIPLRQTRRQWDPSCLVQEYRPASGDFKGKLSIREQKSLLPNDVLSCSITISNWSKKARRVRLVAWTAQEHWPSKNETRTEEVELSKGSVFFKRILRPSIGPGVEVFCGFGVSPMPSAASLNLSERTALKPLWEFTPWSEKVRQGFFPEEVNLDGSTNEGLVYIALSRSLKVRSAGEATARIAFACSPSRQETENNLGAALRPKSPSVLSRLSWEDHFSSVPSFECSDEFLTNYYWYRWYGLKLNTQIGTEGHYKWPFVSEGIGYFRAPISYSAPCHMLENRWMRSPELAEGSLRVFLDNRREDGGFRGYLDPNYYRQEMFYHANWGNALVQLQLIHPSEEFLEAVYDGLRRYAAYFDRARDEEVSGLYDIDNHYETGQEYMHRYTVVNPRADQDHWGEVFRLKGVDVTVYLYELKRALAMVADKLGKGDDAELWRMEADKIKSAVLGRMWDPSEEMFFDVDPRTGQRTNVKAATCFYPYFTDIVGKEQLAGLKKHLFNTNEFWTPFPVPSSSADDEFFSPYPEWKGKRMNCPWNGRVWPMTNSHIAEALANAAVAFDDNLLRKKAAEFITKFISMMFFDSDPKRPNCFEHYNPKTGAPSLYRGIDDYQHSWVNDLIIKYVCGIRPSEFSVAIDPFPFNLRSLLIDNVWIRGRVLKVTIERKNFDVWIDGKQHATSEVGKRVEIQL